MDERQKYEDITLAALRIAAGLGFFARYLRAEARCSKNFATADAIRDGIAPLGITLEDRAGGTEWSGGHQETLDGVVRLLIELRQTARTNKEFATADTIRDRLIEAGVTLEDRPGGTDWSVATMS